MSSTKPPEHRGRDLDDRDEIAEFVTRFYRDIAQDEHFQPYFHTLAAVDWHAHTVVAWVPEQHAGPRRRPVRR